MLEDRQVTDQLVPLSHSNEASFPAFYCHWLIGSGQGRMSGRSRCSLIGWDFATRCSCDSRIDGMSRQAASDILSLITVQKLMPNNVLEQLCDITVQTPGYPRIPAVSLHALKWCLEMNRGWSLRSFLAHADSVKKPVRNL
jgi:hypothetical protein